MFEARHSQQKFIMAQKPVQLKCHDSTVRRDQSVCRTHFLCERKHIVGFSLRVCSRDAISGHQATPTERLRAWPSYEHITCAPATGPCTQTQRDGFPPLSSAASHMTGRPRLGTAAGFILSRRSPRRPPQSS